MSSEKGSPDLPDARVSALPCAPFPGRGGSRLAGVAEGVSGSGISDIRTNPFTLRLNLLSYLIRLICSDLRSFF